MAKHKTPAMSIGAFSQATRLSVRMLRHYAQRGILEPDHVDPATGYRHYTARQISDGVLVRAMRDIGLPIAAMVSVLRHRDDPDALSEALTAHRDQLVESHTKLQDQLRATERLLAQTQEERMFVATRTEHHAAMPVAGLRETLDAASDEEGLWKRFMPLLAEQGIKPHGVCGVTYYDDAYKEADIDTEVWVPIASLDTTVAAPVLVREQPATQVVVATVHGPYDLIPHGFSAAAVFIQEHGFHETGHPYMRYPSGPATTDDPADYVTEVCLPIQ